MKHDFSKIYLLSVTMQGFKRFKEPYEVNLGKLTVVAGGNGQGKTTIADAIAYAFCGTPFWSEKSCDRLQNPEDSATDQISMKENMDPLTGSKNK